MKTNRIIKSFAVALISIFFILAGFGISMAKQKVETDANSLPKVSWTLQTTWAQGWLLHQMAEDLGTMGVQAFVLDRFIPEGQSLALKGWVLTASAFLLRVPF